MSDSILDKIPDVLPVIGTVLHLRRSKKGIDAKRTPLKYLEAGTEKEHRRFRRQYRQELEKAAMQVAAAARLAQLRGGAF